MATSEQAWKEAGERFAALGRELKTRYQGHAQKDEDADDQRAVENAMRRLADALDEVFTAAGKTVRDPEVAEHARGAARSLGDALSTTFGDVSERLGDRFKQTGSRKPPGDLPPKD